MNSREIPKIKQKSWSNCSNHLETTSPRNSSSLKKICKTLSVQEEKVTDTDASHTTSASSSPNKNLEKTVLEKKDLRKRFLRRRVNLSQSERQAKSTLILDVLLAEKSFYNSLNIASYLPIKAEVDTLGIFRKCLEMGKKVFFPKILGSEMVFLKTETLDELTPGPFNILEPPANSERADRLDLVLVPGLVFDLCGNRVGYGKGFYDTFLKNFPRQLSFALAYRFQVLKKIPTLNTDIKMGYIITEEGTINCLGEQGD